MVVHWSSVPGHNSYGISESIMCASCVRHVRAESPGPCSVKKCLAGCSLDRPLLPLLCDYLQLVKGVPQDDRLRTNVTLKLDTMETRQPVLRAIVGKNIYKYTAH